MNNRDYIENYLGSIRYKPDSALLDEIETYYSYVLDSMHMNYADPISANVGFLNNSGKQWTDPQRVGRTFIYVTRPNLNLRSQANINRGRILQYVTNSKLGITCSRFLMYPDIVKNINYSGFTDLSYKHTGALIGTVGDGKIGDLGSSKDESKIVTSGLSYPIQRTVFIPAISNFCTECSGGKDSVISTEQTDQNFNGNYLVYAGNLSESKGPGEVTLTFSDPYGSPVFKQILAWVYYMHYVSKGICYPEINYGLHRIIDYTCSIYVFMLDTDHKTILRWTKYTGCFPKNVPLNNITHNKEIDQQVLSNFSIQFQYNFESAMDPVVLNEFNMISECSLIKKKTAAGKDQAGFMKVSTAEYSSGYRYNVYGDGYKPRITSAENWFKGMNHYLTEPEALFFRNSWIQQEVPEKWAVPHEGYDGTINEVANPYTGKAGESSILCGKPEGSNNGVYGDERFIDDGLPSLEGGTMKPTTNSFAHWQLGMYRGTMGETIQTRQPYIADGNKLMWI